MERQENEAVVKTFSIFLSHIFLSYDLSLNESLITAQAEA